MSTSTQFVCVVKMRSLGATVTTTTTRFRVGTLCYSVSNRKDKPMEIENEIDINETDDVNINALTPKQKALRLNALVKLAQGDVFTTHDFEEALSLTRQLMKR